METPPSVRKPDRVHTLLGENVDDPTMVASEFREADDEKIATTALQADRNARLFDKIEIEMAHGRRDVGHYDGSWKVLKFMAAPNFWKRICVGDRFLHRPDYERVFLVFMPSEKNRFPGEEMSCQRF
jgi:hypothetical protein